MKSLGCFAVISFCSVGCAYVVPIQLNDNVVNNSITKVTTTNVDTAIADSGIADSGIADAGVVTKPNTVETATTIAAAVPDAAPDVYSPPVITCESCQCTDGTNIWVQPDCSFVDAPRRGLGSNSNYILYNPAGDGCNNINNLSVTIDIDEDISSNDGFGFQLNAYSKLGSATVWQQYALVVGGGGQIASAVDNWDATRGQVINHWLNVIKLPTSTLPKGYKLIISLQNDGEGNINKVTFKVIDNNGKATSIISDLTSFDTYSDCWGDAGPQKITTEQLAPIVSFEVNLVDAANGGSTNLTSGKGRFSYTADNLMTVGSSVPPCSAASGIFTGETANSLYGKMTSLPSHTFTQSFEATTPIPNP